MYKLEILDDGKRIKFSLNKSPQNENQDESHDESESQVKTETQLDTSPVEVQYNWEGDQRHPLQGGRKTRRKKRKN